MSWENLFAQTCWIGPFALWGFFLYIYRESSVLVLHAGARSTINHVLAFR